MKPTSHRVPGTDGRCGAQLRGQPGTFCAKFPIRGRSRCRLHGGRSPTGPDHPTFLHGRRSKYVVSQEAYDQARHDLAIARILLNRAVAAGSSGLRELAAIARCARAYAELVEGKALPAAVIPVPPVAASTLPIGDATPRQRRHPMELSDYDGTSDDPGRARRTSGQL